MAWPYYPTEQRTHTPVAPTATITTHSAEVIEAREEVAARLERLAEWIRSAPTEAVAAYDEAYRVAIRASGEIRTLLG